MPDGGQGTKKGKSGRGLSSEFFPFEDYYRIALGILKLKPDDFRKLSPAEFLLAIEGHQMSIGTFKTEEDLEWNDFLNMRDDLKKRGWEP